MNTLAGFPFWILQFDEDGEAEDSVRMNKFIDEVKSNGIQDLFIFSHGWNNDENMAKDLYRGYFEEIRKIMDNPQLIKRRTSVIGTAGVVWPSILWPDDFVEESSGGAAGLGSRPDGKALFTELKKVFRKPDQQKILDELQLLLDQKKRDDKALKQFKSKLRMLITPHGGRKPALDSLEELGITSNDDDWRPIFESLADQERADDSAGGAAGLGDFFGKLWRGAKSALRLTTYWQMKERAGIVGTQGLGPLITRLHEAYPAVKVHLLGHSFGARLVSFALSGLPASLSKRNSPVKSLFLLQGAFSHFTFAESLPHDKQRKGDLAGMAERVDGPLVTTHSLKDLAVCQSYPLASVVARQDAANVDSLMFRWGAMGSDGAQAVDAKAAILSKPGTTYSFKPGQWLNLDGNQVIVTGDPPSGAHSDIIHPHTAWVTLAAAGIG